MNVFHVNAFSMSIGCGARALSAVHERESTSDSFSAIAKLANAVNESQIKDFYSNTHTANTPMFTEDFHSPMPLGKVKRGNFNLLTASSMSRIASCSAKTQKREGQPLMPFQRMPDDTSAEA